MNTLVSAKSVCLSPEGIWVATTSRERERSLVDMKSVVVEPAGSEGLSFEFSAEEGDEGVVEGFVGESAEDFFEEAEDEQFVRLAGIDAAGLQVELLLGVDAGGGRAVRTLH